MSWYEALANTRWLTTFLHDGRNLPTDWKVRLPNEPECEKAGRGGIILPQRIRKRQLMGDAWQTPGLGKVRKNKTPAQRFPWGNDIDANRLNYAETKIETTNPVGIFPHGVSPYGVEELSGNYWEWTRSLWGEDVYNCTFGYPYQPEDGREQLDAILCST